LQKKCLKVGLRWGWVDWVCPDGFGPKQGWYGVAQTCFGPPKHGQNRVQNRVHNRVELGPFAANLGVFRPQAAVNRGRLAANHGCSAAVNRVEQRQTMVVLQHLGNPPHQEQHKGGQARGRVGACVRPSARQWVRGWVRAAFGSPVGAWVRAAFGSPVGAWVRAAFGSPVGGCMGACGLRLASGWVHGCVRAAFGSPVGAWVRAAFGSPVGAWVGACGLRLASGCVGACGLRLASGWVRGCMRAAFGSPVGGCMGACVRPSARQWVRGCMGAGLARDAFAPGRPRAGQNLADHRSRRSGAIRGTLSPPQLRGAPRRQPPRDASPPQRPAGCQRQRCTLS
jgi:hypothetical protein